jgi:hypothetical protein
VTFRATVIPEKFVFEELFRYLQLTDAGGQLREKVAFLSESNTGFGRNVRQGIKNAQKGSNNKELPELVVFPFPLHISDVRTGYEKAGGGKGGVPYLPTAGTKLRIPAEEGADVRDTEPSLYPGLTSVTSERLLTATLATIAHERFRYAAISATDVRDTIFLATLLRQQVPDVQLMLSSSDVMLSHPDYSSFLRGALVGSTYPLYARDQGWSYPYGGKARCLLFPGQSEQGYYNATLALLDHGKAEKFKTEKFFLEYGSPFEKPGEDVRPPVWISILGQSGPQPLAVCQPGSNDPDGPKEYKDYVFPAKEKVVEKPVFSPQQTTLWITPFIALSVFVLVVGWAYGAALGKRRRGQTNGTSDGERSGFLGLFWPRRGTLQQGRQRGFVFVCMASLAAVYAYFALVCAIPAQVYFFKKKYPDLGMEGRGQFWLVLVAVLILLGLVGLGLRSLFALVKRSRSRRAPAWREATKQFAGRFVLPVLIAAVLAALMYFMGWYVLLVPLAVIGIFLAVIGIFPEGGMLVWSRLRKVLARHRLTFLVLALLIAFEFYLVHHGESPVRAVHFQDLFFFDRATNLGSGVSPVVPVFFLGMGFFWWGFCQLKRLYLLDWHRVRNPFPAGPPESMREANQGRAAALQEVNKAHRAARMVLLRPQSVAVSKTVWVVWLILFFTFWRLASRFVPTVEGVWYDGFLLLGLAVYALLLVHGLLLALALWKNTRELLQAIAKLPMRRAYSRLPTRVTAAFGPYLSSERPGRTAHLRDRQKQQDLVLREYQQTRDRLSLVLYPEELPAHLNEKEAPREPSGAPSPCPDEETIRMELSTTARNCLKVLEGFWKKLSLGETFGDPETPEPGSGEASAKGPPYRAPEGADDKAVKRWVGLAEDFVALEVVTYLSQFFVQLRNLMLLLTVGPLLMLFAVTSYPLQPQLLWLLLTGVLIAAVVVGGIKIFVQIERDEVVSRVSGSTPNRLNFHWSFLGSLVTYTLPLLAALVAASTDLTNLINSWVGPLFQALR